MTGKTPQATVHDVARRAGVSIATVSRALAGSAAVRSETRAAVAAAAKALGYRPGFAARAMRQGRSRMVGVALHNIAGGQAQSLHNYEVVIGVNQGLEHAGLLMVLLRLDDLADGPGALALREHSLDGVVAVGELPATIRSRLRALCPCTVWVDGPEWGDDDCLRRDEVQAGRLAVEGIAARGHRAVRYLDSGSRHFAFDQRREGARAAAERLGLGWSVVAPVAGIPAAWRDGAALLVSDLETMRRLLVALAAERLAPGGDLPVACCDDVEEFRSQWPGLSRVAYDRVGLGLAAAEMMRERLDGRSCRSRLLPSAWIPGSSLR